MTPEEATTKPLPKEIDLPEVSTILIRTTAGALSLKTCGSERGGAADAELAVKRNARKGRHKGNPPRRLIL